MTKRIGHRDWSELEFYDRHKMLDSELEFDVAILATASLQLKR